MTDESPPSKKRGARPKPSGTRAIDSRVNISLDASVQEALNEVQERLTSDFGFKPTLNQTVQWLIARARKEGEST